MEKRGLLFIALTIVAGVIFGAFIADREAFLPQQTEGNYYANDNSDVFKKIRVVISVDYSIE